MMKIVRNFFGQFDMFAAPPTLRARQQDKTSSLCSGLVSFALALFFSYVFIYSVVGVVTYKKIDSVQTQSRIGFEQVHAQDVFFGIRVGYLSYQVSIKYFQIGYWIVYEDGSNVTFPMQRCTPQQWKKLGDNYEYQYNKFRLSQFFCRKPQNKIDLKKVFYAPQSQYAVVYVKPCQANRSSTCENLINQAFFLDNLNNIQGAIFTTLYFLDEAINPSSKQPIQKFTNTDVQLAFTLKRGIISTIQLGNYRVQTDVSVSPVQQINVREGNFIHSFRETSIQLKNSSDNYILIYLTLNRKHILVERKVGKLDDMLSYAGGLFSIIIGFLSIFIASFNKYRYQLMVAQGIFHQDQNSHVVKQKDFSFLLYIKYTVFDWITILFCYQPKWQDCQIVQRTRDQANKQIDVTKLFRKIQNLETAITHMIQNRGQRNCLALMKPQSLSNIIKNRQVLEYYDIIIQGKQSITFQQYRISHQILKFALNISKNQHFNSNKISNSDINITQQNFIGIQDEIRSEQIIEKNNLYQTILLRFSNIVKQAQMIQLDQDQRQIENQLSQSYFDLSYQIRKQIQDKIPIKILYRLAKAAKKQRSLQQTSDEQNKISKKKKIVLNLEGNSKIFDSFQQNISQ